MFGNEFDANRFLMLLYVANSKHSVDLYSRRKLELRDILATNRGSPIVSIGAYCLMPNHFHVLVKEITSGGISTFMHRVGTGYTMYFNAKHERVGNLFLKPFRSRHVGTDRYFQHVLQYIHCNPAELYEPRWKEGSVRDIRTLGTKLTEYPYSSLAAYIGRRKSDPILSQDGYNTAQHPSVSRMLTEARSYYSEIATEKFE